MAGVTYGAPSIARKYYYDGIDIHLISPLAYYITVLITIVKSFIVDSPGQLDNKALLFGQKCFSTDDAEDYN
jgi:hypothetical protein